MQLGRSRVPGIKIHDTRVPRLLEVLLHGGAPINTVHLGPFEPRSGAGS